MSICLKRSAADTLDLKKAQDVWTANVFSDEYVEYSAPTHKMHLSLMLT